MEFLKNYWYVLVLALVLLIIVSILMVLLIKRKKSEKLNKPLKQENQVTQTTNTEKENTSSEQGVAVETTKENSIKTRKIAPKTAETKKVKTSEPLAKAPIKKEVKTTESVVKTPIKKEVKTADPKPLVEKSEKKTEGTYRVTFDKMEKLWIVKKDKGLKASKKFKTKQEALVWVEKACQDYNVNLSVHKKDGKFQKKTNI